MQRPRVLFSALMISGLCAAGLGHSTLAGAEPTEKAAGKPKEADMQAMMAAYEKAAEPGPAHKQLQRAVGKWNVIMKSWPAPGAPPVDSTGTAEGKSLLGDRYVQTTFSSTFMGKTFSGVGLSGYDNAKKKFVGTWIDSMSTGMMRSEGTSDPGGKVVTSQATSVDPVTGKESKMRIVQTWDGDDKFVEDFYEKKGSKEVKTMEITYTRAK
jgi:hypothetical protein